MNEKKYPSQLAERFQIRLPDGLRDRIRDSASSNNRSMNAEIVAALEEKFPPKSIDISMLSDFLESLIGVSAPDGNKEYLDYINNALSDAKIPWTVEAGWDGAITFYAHTAKKIAPKPGDEDDDRVARKNKP
ncbi:UNVERIFIED_ORG: hypothetical protein J2W19_003135 [Shinella zoogloeoides]|nr:hypothetical protein [Shinella zoogloeoides]